MRIGRRQNRGSHSHNRHLKDIADLTPLPSLSLSHKPKPPRHIVNVAAAFAGAPVRCIKVAAMPLHFQARRGSARTQVRAQTNMNRRLAWLFARKHGACCMWLKEEACGRGGRRSIETRQEAGGPRHNGAQAWRRGVGPGRFSGRRRRVGGGCRCWAAA